REKPIAVVVLVAVDDAVAIAISDGRIGATRDLVRIVEPVAIAVRKRRVGDESVVARTSLLSIGDPVAVGVDERGIGDETVGAAEELLDVEQTVAVAVRVPRVRDAVTVEIAIENERQRPKVAAVPAKVDRARAKKNGARKRIFDGEDELESIRRRVIDEPNAAEELKLDALRENVVARDRSHDEGRSGRDRVGETLVVDSAGGSASAHVWLAQDIRDRVTGSRHGEEDVLAEREIRRSPDARRKIRPACKPPIALQLEVVDARHLRMPLRDESIAEEGATTDVRAGRDRRGRLDDLERGRTERDADDSRGPVSDEGESVSRLDRADRSDARREDDRSHLTGALRDGDVDELEHP